MKLILTLIIALTLNANTRKHIECQIQARMVGNAVDYIGIGLIDNDNDILQRTAEALSEINTFNKLCKNVEFGNGLNGYNDMIEYQKQITQLQNRIKAK